MERLGDLLLEGSYPGQSLLHSRRCTAQLTLEAQLYGIELNRHCGRAGSFGFVGGDVFVISLKMQRVPQE
jgi:hypothetical protein